MISRRLACAVLLLLAALPLLAQAPHEPWRTITTPHFRIHYPAAYEAWTTSIASRIESIREEVIREVGYEPPEVVDVVVANPVAQANGSAWPFIGWPRMVLWVAPPESSSVIGNYTDWPELLVIHEQTHLVHLLRESRNPFRRILSRFSSLPLGPITGAPRWVSEGYATVLEGELTGVGRPASELRAAILRSWAQHGRLPSYAQINSDSTSWMGMSMAYLVGSAYLEWLRDRSGEESLRNLWRRMTARHGRSFEEAFRGVFGDSPQRLYDRFTAELTRDAMLLEERPDAFAEGELWQDLSWSTEPPALSPDGSMLATVLRSRRSAPELVVYSTAVDEEAEEKQKTRLQKILARDPQDVAPVRTAPPLRKKLLTLPSPNRIDPQSLRWASDGKSILFTSFEPDDEGFLHPDLFLLSYPSGDVRRVTRESDLRSADLFPAGATAVAIRDRHGFSQIVRVNLESGDVTPITDPTLEIVYDDPRVAPDGSSITYVRNAGKQWELVVRELSTGSERLVALPPTTTLVTAPAWSKDGRSVVATIGVHGSIDLWRLDPAGSDAPQRITRSRTAAMQATLGEDEAYFLSLTPDGFDIRRIGFEGAPAVVEDRSGLVAFPSRRSPREFARAPLPSPEPYRARPELSFLSGGVVGTKASQWEAGIRAGDVIGRFDALLVGASGSDGAPTGGAAAGVWRGLPIDLGAHLFHAESGEGENETTGSGVELSAAWRRFSRISRLELRGAVSTVETEIEQQRDTETFATLHAEQRFRPSRGDLAFPVMTAVIGELGDTASVRAIGEAGVSWKRNDARLIVEHGGGDRTFSIGGNPSTILPWSSGARRLAYPALSERALSGDEYDRRGAELTLAAFPLSLFYDELEVPDSTMRLAGLRLDFELDAMPIVRIPTAQLTLGAARILEGAGKDDDRLWLGLTWKP